MRIVTWYDGADAVDVCENRSCLLEVSCGKYNKIIEKTRASPKSSPKERTLKPSTSRTLSFGEGRVRLPTSDPAPPAKTALKFLTN
ncbi:hypothetical protein BDD43_4060 [Mucilaginibacter gracilis]|uniref:Uncharacterized protein n=1 Tax=Mucilaginibacter gracilis TaxID=423350 RepID=A0A495J4D5_9SPHI|nr:hypothetical protein BDD43_4060 [Mucilaginibacter gracilis]